MVGIETARPSPSYYVLLVAIGSCQMGNPYIFFTLNLIQTSMHLCLSRFRLLNLI